MCKQTETFCTDVAKYTEFVEPCLPFLRVLHKSSWRFWPSVLTDCNF